MRAPLACLFATAAACPVPEPANTEVPAHVNTDESVYIALDAWSHFVDVPDEEPPPVRWFAGDCLEYEWGHDCKQGALAYSYTSEEIHLIYESRVSESQMAHELLHWIIWDPEHDSDLWTNEHHVTESLREAGL